MRRLVDRILHLGIRHFVFVALVLFGLSVFCRDAEAGSGLRISPELYFEEGEVLLLCELENESNQEIPELFLSLRLPEGNGNRAFYFSEAAFLREEEEMSRTYALSPNALLQIRIASLKPGESCLLQAEGKTETGPQVENLRTDLELIATLRRGEEEYTTRKRYELTGVGEDTASPEFRLYGERVETLRNPEANDRVKLKRTELSAGRIELDPAKAAPPSEHRRPANRPPVIEILVCGLALWMLSILLKQLLVYIEEGRRKFDPKRRRSSLPSEEDKEKSA